MRNAKRRVRSAILAAIAVAVLAFVALEFGGGADVARSAPDTDITLDDVTILGADLDGDENTIEIPMIGNKLNLLDSIPSARIVKEITITVTAATTVRVSGEFAPPEGTAWHCVAPFVADPGGDANWDQGCTVGSPDYSVVGGQPAFREKPECQWTWTNLPAFPAAGGAHKVVIPWILPPYQKCERFVDESTLVVVAPAFRAGGPAPGCSVNEVSAPAWVPPAPVPNPYNIGDCILDGHRHHVVVATGTIKLRIVDELELELSASDVGQYHICEDFEVMPVGDVDPNLGDNTLQECFELNIYAPVGGLAQLPEVSDSSGRNYGALAGLTAAALVALGALGAGGWYVRRRRLG